jgi:hypothetical protein
VTPNLYLVLSRPPDSVPWPEYDRWYHAHVRENIESPGFLSGRRYALEPGRPDAAPFDHLALYEYDGDYDPIGRNLRERIGRGEIVLPEWFDGITFGSWKARPIDERALPSRA